MLTDLQRDILVKAAEGIQEGMWCRGAWFTAEVEGLDASGSGLETNHAFSGYFNVEQLSRLHRCAEGELALQTVSLGGTRRDFEPITVALNEYLHSACTRRRGHKDGVATHNDSCMGGLDAFEAGQEWARIFREVADS